MKRFLLILYFSSREIGNGLRGIFARPRFQFAELSYEAYWAQRPLGGVEPRFSIMGRLVQPEDTVLDVGCGDGAMLEHLRRARNVHGRGLDISATAVARARQRGVEAHVQTLSDFIQQGSPQFDHVVISEVLEHVPDPEKLVLQGWSLARKTLWLTFPNIAYFPHRARLCAGRFPIQWLMFPGEHLRFWSVPDFKDWLSALHLAPARLYPSNGVILFGLHRLWPNLFANQVVARLDKR